MPVRNIDEAVEMANATTYSLSAALWTTNVHSAMAVAPRIRAGTYMFPTILATRSLIMALYS